MEKKFTTYTIKQRAGMEGVGDMEESPFTPEKIAAREKYIKGLKESGEYGKEYELNISIEHDPIFDGPTTSTESYSMKIIDFSNLSERKPYDPYAGLSPQEKIEKQLQEAKDWEMGVSARTLIRGVYKSPGKEPEEIIRVDNNPSKWSSSIIDLGNKFEDFIKNTSYPYKDYYIITEHWNYDYGHHSMEITKNGESIVDASTDDYQEFGKESIFIYTDDEVLVMYRQSFNDFYIEFLWNKN